MRSTLFYIPHADPAFDIPLFGWGALVVLLAAIVLVMLLAHPLERGMETRSAA